MKVKTLSSRIIFLIVITIVVNSCNNNDWKPLFNGQDTFVLKHYLGIPDSSFFVEGLERDSTGNYTKSLGSADPLNVFSLDTLDNETVIRLSGQVVGGLILLDTISNYHVKLKFKWGDIKWDWMQERPKDGGILYHQGRVRHELQIHEGDVGSYWAKNVILDIPARMTTDIPEAITKAKPFIEHMVSTLRDTMLIFDENAPLHHFDGKNIWQIVIANPYNENPHGEWNTLELICWENHAVHIINGKVNLILLNSFYKEGNAIKPLISGRLTLQSEGAEVFFKDIYIKNLDQTPEILKKYLDPKQ